MPCWLFGQDQNRINLGYGLGYVDPLVRDFHSDTYYASTQILGPFYFRWEHFVGKSFTAGLSTSFVQFNGTANSYYGYAPFHVYGYNVHLRLTYYLPSKVTWIEPYVGAGMGIRDYFQHSDGDYTWTPNDKQEYHTGGELTAGCRFYMIERLSIYCELGLAKTFFQAGLSTKF
jgi:hypothetical protein